ncbi:MAG: DUF983 domain-containing protein [Sphingomonadales bacterium]
MFAGLVKLAPRCTACGLDYSRFNVGDGAVPFLILLVGAITTGGALYVELHFAPPAWVHMLLWPPLVLGLTIGLLRVAKALLLGQEFRHNDAPL